MDDEALIQYKNVEIHQQELCVLSDVNLELHKGEFVYLIGKVGSGKTSLLKTLYGELDVIDGEALLQCDPVSPVCFYSLWHEAQIPGYYIQYGL